MAFDPDKNFAYGIIIDAPAPAGSGTTFTMSNADGATFPDPVADGNYNVTIWQTGEIPTVNNATIGRVTGKAVDTPVAGKTQFTFARTTNTEPNNQNRDIVAGDQVALTITAKTRRDLLAALVSSQVKNEVPSGLVNGANTTYTVAGNMATGSLRVYQNGVRLKGGGVDFTETATGFTMVTAPLTGDILLVDYDTSNQTFATGGASFIDNETPSGLVNGVNAAFTTAFPYIAGSLKVYRDGQRLFPIDDYTETTPGSGIFTFVTAPVTGSSIKVDYQHALSTAGNADTLDGFHASEIMGGWYATNATFTYASVDDPTGVINTTLDLTGVISVGMRIKFVNGGNTIYGIVTAITASAITFLHEIDPSDSLALTLMANSAISGFRYSPWKVPVGFPIDVRKWMVRVADASERTQSTPATNTWYNLGSINIVIPIGLWMVSYQACLYIVGSAVTTQNAEVTLSTANNSESDTDMTAYSWMQGASGNLGGMQTVNREKIFSLAAKTTYYLNAMKPGATASSWLGFYGNISKTIIEAVCAYL